MGCAGSPLRGLRDRARRVASPREVPRFGLASNRDAVSSDLQQQLQITLGVAYILERELGGGGMSRVFLASERALDRKVVVKVLLPELAAGVSVERFRREIQVSAQLQHPHIVPLLSAGEADGLPYFIMPFVTGESLRARVSREGELPITETLRILRDVVSALAYAHTRGVVHRDIKPDNVLLSGGVAVVTDFGVAKAVSVSAGVPGATGVTSLGVALGTPAYMAPEQATASPQTDHRADIYALGVMAYEMLTGAPPFPGRSPQAVLAAHVIEEPEPVERRRPGVPPMLAALIKECLAKRPADRPQAASDVMHMLDAIATPSGGTTPTTTVAVPVRQKSAWRRWWPLAASLVALAVVLTANALWLRSTRVGFTPIPSKPAHVSAIPPGVDSAPMKHDSLPSATKQSPVPPLNTGPKNLSRPRTDRSAPPRKQAPIPRPVEPARDSVVSGITETPPAPAPPPAPVESAPAPAGQPAVTAPAAVPPPPPRPPDPRPEISSTVAEYARAIESQSLGDLRRVYPGMTSVQQRGWEQFFQLVRNVKTDLSVARLDVSGRTAEAQITGTYNYLNTSNGRAERLPVAFHASFTNDGGRWRISQVR